MYAAKSKGAKAQLKLAEEEQRKAVAMSIASWADKHRVTTTTLTGLLISDGQYGETDVVRDKA